MIPPPVNRPYFWCRTCGFMRTHRHLTYGLDRVWALWRVQFHCWIRNHRIPTL